LRQDLENEMIYEALQFGEEPQSKKSHVDDKSGVDERFVKEVESPWKTHNEDEEADNGVG